MHRSLTWGWILTGNPIVVSMSAGFGQGAVPALPPQATSPMVSARMSVADLLRELRCMTRHLRAGGQRSFANAIFASPTAKGWADAEGCPWSIFTRIVSVLVPT